MTLELTRIAAALWNGEEATTSSIFDVADNTTATLTITVPTGWQFFMTRLGGNVTTSDVNVKFQDKHGITKFEWAEFPDFPVIFEHMPFLNESFSQQVLIKFTNTSGATTTVTFLVEGLLIPNTDGFADQFIGTLINQLSPIQATEAKARSLLR